MRSAIGSVMTSRLLKPRRYTNGQTRLLMITPVPASFRSRLNPIHLADDLWQFQDQLCRCRPAVRQPQPSTSSLTHRVCESVVSHNRLGDGLCLNIRRTLLLAST